MKLYRDFTYKTFNPNTNDFDAENKTIWKEVDKDTARKYNRLRFIQHICGILLLPMFISTFAFAALAAEYNWLFIFGFVFGLGGLCGCIYYTADLDNKEDAICEDFQETNFDDEKQECETYNVKQVAIAEEWRAAHPFEEKIRMAKTRGSSVDIAEMVKEYLKLQKGE